MARSRLPSLSPAGGPVCPSSPGGSLSSSPGGGAWGGAGSSSRPTPPCCSHQPHAPSPPVTALSHARTHISLYLVVLQISQKKTKNPTESQSLSQPPGPAGRTACRAEHQLPWGPPPGLLSSPRLLTPLHPPASCPSQGASRVPARCSSGPPAAKALMLKSGPPLLRPPPFLPLLAHSLVPRIAELVPSGPKSLPSWSRNLCPRGAWGWRARDRQQTGSTSRGVGGDEHWRTQLRGGAGREHGKRPHSGAALMGRRQPKEAGPGGASCGARFFLYPSSPRRASHTALGRLESRSTGEQGRGSRPTLDYPRTLRSPRLGAHRLRGCLECGAFAHPAAVLSRAAAFSTGQTGPCFWHFC